MGSTHALCGTDKQRERCVGSILRALETRREIGLRGRSCLSSLSDPQTTRNASVSASIDAVAAWRSDVVNAVKRALTFEGVFSRNAFLIVLARTRRPEKSAQASFEQIGAELRLDYAAYDVRQTYRLAIDEIHKAFVDARVSLDIRERGKKDVAAVHPESAEHVLAVAVLQIIPKKLRVRVERMPRSARRRLLAAS